MPNAGEVFTQNDVSVFVVDICGDSVRFLLKKGGCPIRELFTTVDVFQRMVDNE